MKGALGFWAFFAKMVGGSLLLGLVLIGPGLLVMQLTGSAWLGGVLMGASLIAFLTFVTWSRDPPDA